MNEKVGIAVAVWMLLVVLAMWLCVTPNADSKRRSPRALNFAVLAMLLIAWDYAPVWIVHSTYCSAEARIEVHSSGDTSGKVVGEVVRATGKASVGPGPFKVTRIEASVTDSTTGRPLVSFVDFSAGLQLGYTTVRPQYYEPSCFPHGKGLGEYQRHVKRIVGSADAK
jgi:hypothetical protein